MAVCLALMVTPSPASAAVISPEQATALFQAYQPDAVGLLTDLLSSPLDTSASSGGFVYSDASQGFVFGTQAGPVSVTPIGMSTGDAAPAGSSDSTVIANVLSGVDLAVGPSPAGMTAFVQVRDAAAARTFSWKIGTASQALTRTSSGVTVLDAAGTAAGQITTSAHDALGLPVATSLQTSGNTMTLTATRPLIAVYPLEISVKFAAPPAMGTSPLDTDPSSWDVCTPEGGDCADSTTSAASSSPAAPAPASTSSAAVHTAAIPWMTPQRCDGTFHGPTTELSLDTVNLSHGQSVRWGFIISPAYIGRVASTIPSVTFAGRNYVDGVNQGGPVHTVSPYYVLHSSIYRVQGVRGQMYLHHDNDVLVYAQVVGRSPRATFFGNSAVMCRP